jgi:hypothetical protein
MKKGKAKSKKTTGEKEMLPAYDFRPGIRGKYASRFASGSNLVLVAPDMAELFPDSRAVNGALRVLARAARRPRSRPPGNPPVQRHSRADRGGGVLSNEFRVASSEFKTESRPSTKTQ